MANGTIKRLVRDRGFGFIVDDHGTEYFFHRSGVIRQGGYESLSEGTKVSFDTEETQKGWRAKDVQ